MSKVDENRIGYWGAACLLAFSPAFYGGNRPWAALFVVAGIGILFLFPWLCSPGKAPATFLWTPGDFFLLLGLTWVLFSLFRPSAVPDGVDSFFILLGCAGFFFMGRRFSSSGLAPGLIKILCFAGAAYGLMGLFQMAGFIPHDWWKPAQFMASGFVNHNHFAAYLELLLPFSFLFWIAPFPGEGFFSRSLSILSSLFITVGILLSCSRGAWLSLTVSSFILGLAALRQKNLAWNWRKMLLPVFFMSITGFVIAQPPIRARLSSLLEISEDTSAQMRQKMWQGTWDLVKENPLLGQGAGSFVYSFPRHRPAGLYRLANYAHNEYLQIVAEFGAVGLAITLCLAFFVLVRMFRLSQSGSTPWKKGLGWAGLFSFISVALHSVVDFPWHIPAVAFHASVLAGLVTTVSYEKGLPFHQLQWNVPKFALPLFIGAGVVTSWLFAPLIVADFWAWRGELELQAKRIENSIHFYEKATHLVSYRIKYHKHLAKALTDLATERVGKERDRNFSRAAEEHRKALALVPYDAASAHELGEVLKKMGNFNEADHWLSEAVRNDPRNPLYWKDHGELKLILGQSAAAAHSFQEAALLARPFHFFSSVFGDLDQADYFLNRGQSALSRGLCAYAQTSFSIAEEMNPGDHKAQLGLAISTLNAGDFEKSLYWMSGIEDPVLQARWFAALAERYDAEGKTEKARATVKDSLKLDPSNLLARHLQWILARQAGASPEEALHQLLALNRPPVFVEAQARQSALVWEPQKGHYPKGKALQGSWGLFGQGAIHQSLALPPGRIHFQFVAWGSKAKGVGPTMTAYWNGRPILTTEVSSDGWLTYDAKTKINPGESVLTVAFTNDLKDLKTHEDRNLKLAKVVATWEPL